MADLDEVVSELSGIENALSDIRSDLSDLKSLVETVVEHLEKVAYGILGSDYIPVEIMNTPVSVTVENTVTVEGSVSID